MDAAAESLNGSYRYFLMCSCIIPRPIAWVGTVNEDQTFNLAPFSFFNAVSSTPPIICLGIGPDRNKPEKDTLRNLKRTGELAISIPSFDLVDKVEATSATLDYGRDEFAEFGLTPLAGRVFTAPPVKEAGVAFECLVDQIIPLKRGGSTLILAEIKHFHVRDDLLDARSCVDSGRFQGLARMSAGRYASLGEAFKAKKTA